MASQLIYFSVVLLLIAFIITARKGKKKGEKVCFLRWNQLENYYVDTCSLAINQAIR